MNYYLRQLGALAPFCERDEIVAIFVAGVEEGANAVLQCVQWSPDGEQLMARDGTEQKKYVFFFNTSYF